jgi:type III pantothenate kinase
VAEGAFIGIDVGNTNVTFGVADGDGPFHITRVPARRFISNERTGGEDGGLEGLATAAADGGLEGLATAAAGGGGTAAMVSVNPPVAEALIQALAPVWGEGLLVVGRNLPLDVRMAVDNPAKVGADRVLAAVAGHARAAGAAIVTDVGSAVTVDAIDADGVFLGGFIYPGPGLGAWALSERTAALGEVGVNPAAGVPGRSTEEAIGGALYHGTLGAIRAMTAELRRTTGGGAKAYLTGGGASPFARALAEDGWEHVRPLVLEGLRLLVRTRS